jgi:F-type H+-transporting ATPase subunit delta
MKHTALIERYAKTLFIAAQKENLIGQVSSDMKLLQSMFSRQENLGAFLHAPLISSSEKLEVLKKAFSKTLCGLTNQFIELLSRKNRIYILEGVCSNFQELENEFLGIKKGVILSATPLLPTQMESISLKLSAKNNKRYVLENKIDKSLLGGFLIKIDDYVIDSSLKNKLLSLKASLMA